MATHSSILAGKIPWKKECGGLQFTKQQRVGFDSVTKTRFPMDRGDGLL